MTRPSRPRTFRLLLLGAAVAATLVVSVTPRLPSTTLAINDKLGHVVVYGVNGALAASAFPSISGLRWALAGLLAMGSALELFQVALPRREGSWLDAAANALGLGVGGALLVRRKRATRA